MLLALIANLGFALLSFARQATAAAKPESQPEPEPDPPPTQRDLSDFRRATFAELPPDIRERAKSALGLPLGTTVPVTSADGREWLLLLETHHNASKNAHKGVSVLAKRTP